MSTGRSALPRLVALDVALLLPPGIHERAIVASASLPARDSKGLRLDADHVPHITLTQQFVAEDEMPTAMSRVESVVRHTPSFLVQFAGGGSSPGGRTVWMTVVRTAQLGELHAALMEVLQPFERSEGAAAAFVGQDARPGDVAWVAGFRSQSALARFTPHVTLGHAARPPRVEPLEFQADVVAACHLGRFCSCRRVIRSWHLGGEGAT